MFRPWIKTLRPFPSSPKLEKFARKEWCLGIGYGKKKDPERQRRRRLPREGDFILNLLLSSKRAGLQVIIENVELNLILLKLLLLFINPK